MLTCIDRDTQTRECTHADTTGPALESPAPAALCFSLSALRAATFSLALALRPSPATKERSPLRMAREGKGR